MAKSGKVPVRERRSYKKFRQFMIHRDPVHTLLVLQLLAWIMSQIYWTIHNVVCDAMGRFTTDIHPLDLADYAYIVHPVHVNK